MSIKLIVSDLDGTLLNENVEISDQTANAILTAQDAGIEFAIATGRTVEGGYSLAQQKGIRCPFIELNGARFFDENEILHFTRDIDQKDIQELVQILEHYKVHNEFITQKGSYSNNSVEEHIESYKKVFRDINKLMSDDEVNSFVATHLKEFKIKQVKNFDFLIDQSELQLLKVLLNAQEDKSTLNKIKKAVNQNLPDLIVTSASNFNLEINHIQANKGQAVSDFAQLRGYSADEVITVGDNINDLTMLEWATHSYAVDNAHKLAKKAATYSAPNHADEAVTQIIEKVLAGDKLAF